MSYFLKTMLKTIPTPFTSPVSLSDLPFFSVSIFSVKVFVGID